MAKPPLIVFCGGGSGGHIAASLAVAHALKHTGNERIVFFCAWRRDDRAFIRRHGERAVRIPAPKSPRGFTFRWLVFPLLFPVACLVSFFLLVVMRPKAVFSKGGYVSVPVCLAAYFLRTPVVLHESDAVTGMGNRLLTRIARRVCHGFPLGVDAGLHRVYTGNPVREEVLGGSREEGLRITGFTGIRPVILVIGGSQGAEAINQLIIRHLDALTDAADVIHLTGSGKSAAPDDGRIAYWHAPFVYDELPHLYALADLVVTRAGANVLAELGALRKPAVVIPLVGVAHDHQVRNAQVLASGGAAIHLSQKDGDELPDLVRTLLKNADRREALGKALSSFFPQDAAQRCAQVLRNVAGRV